MVTLVTMITIFKQVTMITMVKIVTMKAVVTMITMVTIITMVKMISEISPSALPCSEILSVYFYRHWLNIKELECIAQHRIMIYYPIKESVYGLFLFQNVKSCKINRPSPIFLSNISINTSFLGLISKNVFLDLLYGDAT